VDKEASSIKVTGVRRAPAGALLPGARSPPCMVRAWLCRARGGWAPRLAGKTEPESGGRTLLPDRRAPPPNPAARCRTPCRWRASSVGPAAPACPPCHTSVHVSAAERGARNPWPPYAAVTRLYTHASRTPGCATSHLLLLLRTYVSVD